MAMSDSSDKPTRQPRLKVTDLADLLQKPLDWSVVSNVRRSGFREGWIACLEDLYPFISADVYQAAWDFWAEELRLWKFAGKESPPDFHYKPPKKPRRGVSNALRFSILQRDGFRCQLCGATASDGPEVRLHVDHKTAWIKGGANTPDNLWTLCRECNMGKGTRDIALQ